MNNMLKVGLIGLAITLVLDFAGILIFRQPAAQFFAGDWWSVWFPSFLVWIVIAIIGIGRQLSRKPERGDGGSV